jgi:hypothetical protein
VAGGSARVSVDVDPLESALSQQKFSIVATSEAVDQDTASALSQEKFSIVATSEAVNQDTRTPQHHDIGFILGSDIRPRGAFAPAKR